MEDDTTLEQRIDDWRKEALETNSSDDASTRELRLANAVLALSDEAEYAQRRWREAVALQDPM